MAGDYDNDGRPDLYLSQARAPNRLLHNDGPQPGGGWRFSDTTAKAGVAAPNDSFPAMWFDYDNDGWLDVYVGGYLGQSENVAADFLGIDHKADRSRLYRNRGDGTFADVTREAGLWHTPLAMGLNYGDLDNDGWLDFYEGTGNPDFHTLVPNRMFRNDGGKRFQEVTTAGNFGHLQKGHGIAFADVDNDGDQDVFEKMGGAYQADRAYSVLFENPHAAAATPSRADWVEARARRHDREPRRARRPDHGAAADAGRAAPPPSRGVDRRQLRLVAVPDLRRPRRRDRGHRRRRQLAGRPGPAPRRRRRRRSAGSSPAGITC